MATFPAPLFTHLKGFSSIGFFENDLDARVKVKAPPLEIDLPNVTIVGFSGGFAFINLTQEEVDNG